MFFSHTAVVLAALAGVNAHATFLNLEGEPGPKSVAFAVIDDLARNCTVPSPCQRDATIIRQGEIAAGVVGVCGRTEGTGSIDIKSETQKAIDSGALARVKGGTTITMDVHQVNADGAGPFVCDVDQDGSGNFTPITITQDVPGANGLSQAKTAQFQMKAVMPDNLSCTGGPGGLADGGICIVRCRNAAQAGPFGACIPVIGPQAAGGNNNGNNGNGNGGNTGNNRSNNGGNNRANNGGNKANNRANNNNRAANRQ
ncbi:MAS3 protein [Magnaporthiopsis poae ATCC 64411]|uniref:MAS3 protein n=1 Tax=Magnaporthiopsis poae (strain ATCC 64411 / 73-15) TaxID=644358 RepID=A0A0C4E597_MAGP6|nr:MAS3 protein [Magnaporthiopsis poae ATCC 64411]